MKLKNLIMVAIVLVGAIAFTGCTRTAVHYESGPDGSVSKTTTVVKTGPPPHAPAHGYRHKHGSSVLVYEKSMNLYVVSGHVDHFYYKDKYYRRHHGEWQRASSMNGNWKKVKQKKLPPGLRTSQHAKAKKK